VAIEGVELRAIQPYTGAASGDAVTVTVRPEDCIVLSESADPAGMNEAWAGTVKAAAIARH
jgi:hypothetical protein